MKLQELPKGLTALEDVVGFKWVKDPKKTSITGFEVVDNRYEDGGNRMGNYYTCQAIAVGNKVTKLKVGDLFLLPEYDKIDQGTNWNEDVLLFCRESKILALLDKHVEITGRDRLLSAEEENSYDRL